ncbi:hypothetical protein FITA111629_14195 [Filibacter tadaridae]|uniref:Small, acid-soluble spore protein Tlp n=1 Tax=Filibacter tadaridae TaxID=2483811 RepID=A0A3P5WS37_9BACL|nr:hypothetical protein [Filibacter tadaridae]VDC23992.1 hypothetical protein FILTAD_00957 [Filibacter tadaridae]
MAKGSDARRRRDNPNTFLSNSVEKADRAVKQAMSHPEEIAIEHAFNSILRAEKSFANAEQHDEENDLVRQNKEQLAMMKRQLSDVQGIVDEQ